MIINTQSDKNDMQQAHTFVYFKKGLTILYKK